MFSITSEGKLKLLSEDIIINQYIFNYYILRIVILLVKKIIITIEIHYLIKLIYIKK